ncbi:hypothetical protein SAMN02910297_01607 [Methanobrevibacter olleyae]|uniref:Uncharacterized protein n=1 Tax=Methanobrevibacter olleyae TaxID=294671 RepID=A0A1I4K0S9_METOL|nr:hypothetical protein SAMN02910297_01607 [Methanobrevibacter olleyae]
MKYLKSDIIIHYLNMNNIILDSNKIHFYIVFNIVFYMKSIVYAIIYIRYMAIYVNEKIIKLSY